MNYEIASCIINAATSLSLGMFVWLRNPRDKRYVLYGLGGLAVFVWSVFKAFAGLALDASSAVFWARCFMAAATFIPVFYLHFILELLGKKEEQKAVLASAYVFSAVSLLMILTPYFVAGASPKLAFSFWPDAGPLFYLFLPAWSFFALYGVYVLLKAYFKYEGIQKVQLQYVLAATVVGWTGGAMNYPLWFSLPLYPYGNIFVSFYMAIMAYAIIKHHMLDIELIIRRGLVYSLISAVVAALNIFLIYSTGFFLRNLAGYSVLWTAIPAVFISVLLFQPLRDWAQDAIDRVFYKTRYETQLVINRFAEGLKKFMGTGEIIEFISRVAFVTFAPAGAACYLYSEERSAYERVCLKGSMASCPETLPVNLIFIKMMKETGHSVSREELASRLRAPGLPAAENGKIICARDELDGLSAVIAVPGISRKKDYGVIGFMLLAKKRSEDRYSEDDLFLLEMLSDQVAARLENALLYLEKVNSVERSMKTEKLAALGNATSGLALEAKKSLGNIEALAKEISSLKDSREKLLNIAPVFFAEAEKIKLLMQGVLDFSRTAEPRLGPVPLRPLVDEMLRLVEGTFNEKGIGAKVSVDGNLLVNADKNSLKHVFLNLLMNCADAMPDGGQVSMIARTAKGAVKLEVSDTGCGIPKEALGSIFEPFFSTKEHSSGLGLSIAKKIIEQNKGSISVESWEGEGTKFTLVFEQA